MKSFIPLFGSKRDDHSQVEQPPLPLRTRLGLYDQNREGLKIQFCPDKSLAVVSDEFGRVTLMDVKRYVALRMWKGYRDAECGWLEAKEDGSSRKSLLLVIYAPKRGLVEVWRCVKGRRVAAFNVGKNCRLLFNNYSVFGLSHLMHLDNSIAEYPCFLFDRSTGRCFVFDIPFVCSLTDQNSALVKDNHYLNEFKAALDEVNIDKAFVALQQVNSSDVLKQALLYSVGSASVSTTRKVAEKIRNLLVNKSDQLPEDSLDYSSKLLVQSCSRVCQLCDLYSQLEHFNKTAAIPVCDFMKDPPNDIESLSKSLGWPMTDVAKCISLFGLRHSVVSSGAGEHAKCPPVSISRFINSFAIEQNQIFKDAQGNFVIEEVPIDVKWTAAKGDVDYFSEIAAYTFACIFSADSAKVFKIFDRSVIKASCLLRLLFLFWTSNHKYVEHWKHWVDMSFAVRTIASQLAETTEEDCLLSASWKSVCGILIASHNLPASLIGAYITKAVASEMNIEKSLPKSDSDPEKMWGDDEWETLSLDEERLNLLIKQIEDTFLLNLLLKSNKQYANEQALSLSYLLKSNAGIVSEHVSKWAVRSGISPSALVAFCENVSLDDDEIEEAAEIQRASEVIAPSGSLVDEETVKELITHVRRCFPYSLEVRTTAK